MTGAEQRFLATCLMADVPNRMVDAEELLELAWSIDGETFPIVASTFDALTQERPELRPHYERARLAWEASL